MDTPGPDHVARNRRAWDAWAADHAAPARDHWAAGEPRWGIWGVPEADVRLMPEVAGRDVIELGCGTAYVSAWVARRGGRPVGIDNSPAQLATARELQREHGLEFPLLLGNAEEVPLPDASFDVAISEYGAAIWCDPYRWIPEAARLLRPGGVLTFLGNSSLLMLCQPDEAHAPASDRLLRPLFGMHRFEWSFDDSVEFHLSHGDWIALFRETGFAVERLVELRPAPDAAGHGYDFVTLEWSRRWPCEEAWVLRKGG